MVPASTNDRIVELAGGGLRVRFALGEDRFAHDIWAADGSSWRCLLRSIEGTPQADWPPSPPLQSVHREDRDGRQLALAVGMAGRSHWSASVELDLATREATFDVACRVRGDVVGWLGSCYRLVDASCEAGLERGRWVLVPGMSGLLVALESGAEPDGVEVELASGCLRIAAETSGPAGAARTFRWKYRVRLLGDQH